MESNNIINANTAQQSAQQTPGTNNTQNRTEDGGLNGGAELAEDFDSFLSLLTTQLQNQDPLEPMKSQEFTNQLVKFSGVEQSIKTNDKLDELLALQGDGRTSTAVSMIGKNVEAESSQLSLKDGTAELSYELDDRAAQATVLIADDSGNIVRSLDVNGAAGEHDVTWDGTDSAGNQLDDGVYTMQLAAVDGEQKTVQGKTYAINEVAGFEERDGTVHLDLGGHEVKLDDVKAVHAADADNNA